MQKISIIIPVYNKSKYLRTILSEVSNQSFKDFECLLIDDGSKDNSGEICDEFALKDNRFKVFHIENGGVSHARNWGLDRAKGEYITFIDADDEIYHDFIENLFTCISKSGADIAISGYEKFWDYKKEILTVSHPELNGLYDFNAGMSNFAKIQNEIGLFGCCVSKIFKRNICENIRFDENIRLAEDFDFYLKLYSKVNKIYFDEKHLYSYRQEADNSSVTDDSKIDYLTQLKINLRYRDFLISKGYYSADNKAIVDKKLSDYVFFSAFHCPDDIMSVRFSELTEIQKKENIRFINGGFLHKMVLNAFNKGKPKSAENIIKTYRLIRSIIKR